MDDWHEICNTIIRNIIIIFNFVVGRNILKESERVSEKRREICPFQPRFAKGEGGGLAEEQRAVRKEWKRPGRIQCCMKK